MTKLVLLIACAAVFSIASALDCYHCDKATCKEDMKQWQKLSCGKIIDTTVENVCLKLTYKDKDTGKEAVSRKCATAPKAGEYKCPTTEGEAVSCPICKTDLCNSAARINLSIVTISGMLLAYLLPKYML